jgi:alanyl-tRNA synthetase
MAQEQLLDLEARLMVAQTELCTGTDGTVGKFLLVSRTLQDRKLEDCKQLALKMANEHGCVALLGLAGDKGHLIFAAPPDSAYDVRPILRQACAVIGGGGGGRPHLAQGGGPAGDVVSIQQALDVAVQMVCQQDAAK